jgi:hypothetical protein
MSVNTTEGQSVNGGRGNGGAGAAVASTEPIGRVVMRWLTRASVVGMALSLVIHLVMLVLGGYVHLGGIAGHGKPDAPVEVATITGTELSAMEETDLNSATPGVEDSKAMDVETHVKIDLPGGSGMSDTGDLGALGDGLGGAGSGTGIGLGDGAGGGGAGTAKFFNVETRGQRFAFIVDTSGSMAGPKLDGLKRELSSSIDALPETVQFIVVAFNSDATAVTGERWREATAKNKNEAIRAIMKLEAYGGTEPLPGFSIAMGRMRPRPDVVYFLTDGVFAIDDADRIITLCKNGGKAPVHAMTFVERDGEMLLRKIAKDTGGTYTHIPGANR